MKKLSFLFLLSSVLFLTSIAQEIPRGMKYQAVARDLKGEVIANAKIELRINLISKKDVGQVAHYSEIHAVETNQLGLFSLVVGNGKTEQGDFSQVPWSTSDIWMEIQIKTNGQSDFTAISNSQLLAVPYAYYAATAGELKSKDAHPAQESSAAASARGIDPARCPCEGGLSQIKLLYLGTSGITVKVWGKKDQRDLLATFTGVNNGDILTVNANNYPDGKFKNETYFEVVTAGIPIVEISTECEELKEPWEVSLGETFGNFSVLSHRDRKNNAECTVCDLKKEWHVGGNGLMDLCNRMGTKSYTDLVFITNNIERLKITKDGDISINNNLKVGRDVEVGNDLYVKKNVFLNTQEGSTTNNGNFTVANGKVTSLTGTLTVDGATLLKDSLKVIKNSENFVASFINTNTNKGDGIQIKLGKTHPGWSGSGYLNVTNVGAEIFQAQINTIRGWVINHNAFTPNDLYSLIPSSLIAGSTCNIVNLVIDKVNSSLNLPLNMPDVVMPDVVMPSIHLPALGLYIPVPVDKTLTVTNGFDLNPPTTIFPRTTILPGFQMLPTIPHIPCGNLPTLSVPNIDFNNVNNSLTNDNQFVSFVDKDNRELGSVRAQSVNNWSANYLDGAYFIKLMAGIVGLDVPQGVAAAVAGFTDIAKSYNNIGVEYASGHADYAEWLERTNPFEVISAGDIVGVRGGKVSKNLVGAEQILAVSHNPIVLGNMPSKEKEVYGNKIAFTGQVPVKVMGPVNVGDYIVAKGDISGYGVAVNPANITTSDLKFTVGRSWEANVNEGPKMVNTLIGIDNGDYIKIMKESQEKIATMEQRMKLLEEKIEKIITVQAKGKSKK